MTARTIQNRIYKGIILGIQVRKSIGKDKIFRMRRGHGYYTGPRGDTYQDQFNYFVPGSINNVQSEPYRRQWIAAVHKWNYDLTPAQKLTYKKRLHSASHMSGYNLFMKEAMKGQVEMFVDRGDPATYDYAKTDLTIDGLWHDLNLSLLVPKGAKAILLCGHIEGNAVDWRIEFRKKGNINEINHCGMDTLRANVERHRTSIVAIDANRVIQYKADNQAWTTIDLAVRGWWT